MSFSIDQHIRNSIVVKNDILSDQILLQTINDVSMQVITTLNSGGKILFAGNGGSAADSQHLAAEFVSKLSKPREPLAAMALTTDTSALTAIRNDYGFEQLFLRQLIALGNTNDFFIGITTSGKSPNILNCLKYCNENSIKSCILTGKEVENEFCDFKINVPSNNVANIQESHIMIGHIICAIAEEYIFFNKS